VRRIISAYRGKADSIETSLFGLKMTLAVAARAVWFNRRVLADERRLEARFGVDYAAYRRQVKRWIPGIL
jgi:protein-S-isoprenylcysteine O-methyltransferase Ste14